MHAGRFDLWQLATRAHGSDRQLNVLKRYESTVLRVRTVQRLEVKSKTSSASQGQIMGPASGLLRAQKMANATHERWGITLRMPYR